MSRNPNNRAVGVTFHRYSPFGTRFKRSFIVFFLSIIGIFSLVSAADFSTSFSQAFKQVDGMDLIFTGATSVSNLYAKALKISRDKEFTATKMALDILVKRYAICPRVTTLDFMNIMYYSNSSFKSTFDILLPSSTQAPTTDDINRSYALFFACKNIVHPLTADLDALNKEISDLYFRFYKNTFSISSLDEKNYGSDYFRNGTLEDSAFDLLYDINQLGVVFFDGFKDAPQLLFYRLPASQQAYYPASVGSASSPSGSSPSGSSSSVGVTTVLSSSSSTNAVSSAGGSSSQVTNPAGTSSPLNALSALSLAEVNAFINRTNDVSPSVPAGAALVLGNQCLAGSPSVVEEQAPLMTPQEYIATVDQFEQAANQDILINVALLDDFVANYPLPSGANSQDPGHLEQTAADLSQKALAGEASPGTCQSTCNNLPLDKQAKCEYSCAGSCLSRCDRAATATQSQCQSDYTDDLTACDSASTPNCNAQYQAATKACSSLSTSSCDTDYKNQLAACQLMPDATMKNVCIAQAAYVKGVCVADITIRKTTCPSKALLKKVSCAAKVGLSVPKKAACKVAAAARKTSCLSSVATDKALCVSDCTCFLVSGPNGSRWKNMEDMYRIRFCKVPVQKKPLSPGKTVYSIQSIFQEILDVLEGLRDSGQTTKFSQTKEFLDGNIKIKFAENLAFKLQVGFKPVFKEISADTKIKEQKQIDTDLSIGILNINPDAPEAEDYNKYVVVTDVASNRGAIEPGVSSSDNTDNTVKHREALDKSREHKLTESSIDYSITSSSQNTIILLVDNILEFLKDNQSFMDNLTNSLSELNAMSEKLKEKILTSPSQK